MLGDVVAALSGYCVDPPTSTSPLAGKSPCVCVVCVSAGACVCVCARVCVSVSFLRPSCDVQICRSTDYPLKVSLPLLFSAPPPPPPPSRTELLSTWTPPSWQFIMHHHQLWAACPQTAGRSTARRCSQ